MSSSINLIACVSASAGLNFIAFPLRPTIRQAVAAGGQGIYSGIRFTGGTVRRFPGSFNLKFDKRQANIYWAVQQTATHSDDRVRAPIYTNPGDVYVFDCRPHYWLRSVVL